MSPEYQIRHLGHCEYTDFSRELKRLGDEGPHVIFRALDRDISSEWPWYFRLPGLEKEHLTPYHLLMRLARAGQIRFEMTIGPTILEYEWRAIRFFDDHLALVGGALISQSESGREVHLYQFVSQDYLVKLLSQTHATLGTLQSGILTPGFTPIHPNDFLNPPGQHRRHFFDSEYLARRK